MSNEDKLGLAYYIDLGEKCKLEGGDLIEWAEKKLKDARELEREREERNTRREEREIKKLELLKESAKSEGEMIESKREDEGGKKWIKMRLVGLKGGNEPEDIDNLIDIFEREAIEIGLEGKRWCHEFRKILLDRGCDHYTTELGAETDYVKLKKEIQKHYGLTCAGYSDRFWNMRPDKGDKSGSYIRKVKYYLKRWVELSGIDKTYDGLLDLILRDKVTRTVATDVRHHILTREPKTIDDVEKGCDNYFSIFPNRPLGQTETQTNDTVATISDRKSRDRTPQRPQSPFRQRPQSPYRPQSPFRQRPQPSYRSQSPFRQRPQSPYRSHSPIGKQSLRQQSAYMSPDRSQKQTYDGYKQKHQAYNHQNSNECYTCGQTGHWSRDCWRNKQVGQSYRDETRTNGSEGGDDRRVRFNNNNV